MENRSSNNRLGSQHDVLAPRGAVCQEISALLKDIVKQSDGQVSFGGELDALPAQPGLVIAGVGPVSVPLQSDEVARVMGLCSNQGKTVMPQQVTMTNPDWNDGIQKLCELSAEKLGLKGVALEATLSKLVLYGAGVRSDVREQHVKCNGREVATLLVQLPSEYTGGDLAVSGGESHKSKFYDVGRANGTAAFKPHYVVYNTTTNASHTFGKVTRGYRLVLEYVLCRPRDVPYIGGKGNRDFLLMQLAESMKQLTGQPETEEDGEADGSSGRQKQGD